MENGNWKLETGNWKLGVALGGLLLIASAGLAHERKLMSPDGAVLAAVSVDSSGQLVYGVAFHGEMVVSESPIGLTLDGADLGKVASLTALNVREVRERYPTRGVHAEARFDALRALYCVRPQAGPAYGLQVTVANGGFAWRLLVPGTGEVRRVQSETACWRLPPASRVWFAERLSDWKLKTYAGEWVSAPLTNLCRVSPQGPVQTMPLVAELPEERGYALVTEAALTGYSGLRLLAEPDGSLRGVFTEKEGFPLEGGIVTPWRVVLLAKDLNALVNSDLVASLNPPPDPELFGASDWTAGGRSVWSWWQGDEATFMTVEGEKRMIDCAARLKFEFTTLDEGWEAWTNAFDVLKEVCDYGRTNSVRVFVWKHSKELNLPTNDFVVLRGFLDRVRDAGAAGVKVDFMNGEDAGLIRFDERVLREAAARKLLVNFHGCQKPSGESRTYPNEVTREGVRGLELNRLAEGYLKKQRAKGADASARPYVAGGENQNISASHNAALPFTRCVVGQADYTPVAFSRRGDTTWAHQMAAAYLITSPLLVMAEHPQRLLDEPRLADAVPFVQALPASWDETRVLEGSRIGELAAFARRKGEVWYVAMVNGQPNLKLVSFSPSFTGWRQARLSQLADASGRADELRFSTSVISGTASLIVTLEPCGGFVARLERE
jgi:alpha-glucosidase